MNDLDLKLQCLRDKRNRHLNSSDWRVLPDSPFTPEQRQQWIDYRQALRDLPDTIDLELLSACNVISEETLGNFFPILPA